MTTRSQQKQADMAHFLDVVMELSDTSDVAAFPELTSDGNWHAWNDATIIQAMHKVWRMF